MAAKAQLLTAEDLWNLPDDGMQHELVRGVLHVSPPPGFEHEEIAPETYVVLRT